MIIKQSNYPDENLGNVILAAHNGSSYRSYFKKLSDLSIGDVAYINYKNVEYKYKLVNTYTQPKTGNLIIYRNNEKSTLTLITCTKNSKTTQTIYILREYKSKVFKMEETNFLQKYILNISFNIYNTFYFANVYFLCSITFYDDNFYDKKR